MCVMTSAKSTCNRGPDGQLVDLQSGRQLNRGWTSMSLSRTDAVQLYNIGMVYSTTVHP